MDFKYVFVGIHLLFWLLVIQLLFDVSGLYNAIVEMLNGANPISGAIFIIPFMVLLFYVNTQYLLPKYLNQKYWKRYLIGLAGCFILLLLSGRIVYHLFEYFGIFFDFSAREFIDTFLVNNFFIIGLSTGLGFAQLAFKNAERVKKVTKKQKETELKYLTAQVNPHFLFNTLNSIYYLSTEEPAPKTTEAILQLSEIMRYPIREGRQKEVPLSNEIKFIDSYITLQKIRLGEAYPVSFKKEGNFDNIKIAPLLFIPLVENAFKYGISIKHQSSIHFSVACQKNQLVFIASNEITKTEHIVSHQLGVSNLKERLALIYDQDFFLEQKELGSQFLVKLTIKFNN